MTGTEIRLKTGFYFKPWLEYGLLEYGNDLRVFKNVLLTEENISAAIRESNRYAVDSERKIKHYRIEYNELGLKITKNEDTGENRCKEVSATEQEDSTGNERKDCPVPEQ